METCNIPNTVKSIGDACFQNCKALKSLDIQGTASSLKNAFSGCTSLTSVNIPALVTSLERTFIGCTSLVSVNIPVSVTSLERTFEGCTSLVSINIPASVTSLMRAFSGCTSLSKAYCNWNSLSNIQTWGDCFVFGPTLSVYLIVPKGMVDLYKTTSPWFFFKTL